MVRQSPLSLEMQLKNVANCIGQRQWQPRPQETLGGDEMLEIKREECQDELDEKNRGDDNNEDDEEEEEEDGEYNHFSARVCYNLKRARPSLSHF